MAAVAEVEVELWMCKNASILSSLSLSSSSSVSLSRLSLSSLCVGVDAVRDTLTTKNLVGNRALPAMGSDQPRCPAISRVDSRFENPPGGS